jgi:EAL domain-containing protein (putative c-di-GMP-specific phosphodiesterase class I)
VSKTLSQWRKAGFDGTLGVNLSASLFERDGLVERLYEPARCFDIAADKLDFEVTESSVMNRAQRDRYARGPARAR